jgi:hypothetical protein
MSRIRHCLECNRCGTRYLISRSPYGNGAWITFTANRIGEGYVLHCSCRGIAMPRNDSEVLICEVSKVAYERGFGTEKEIVPIAKESREEWSIQDSDWKGDRRNEPRFPR